MRFPIKKIVSAMHRAVKQYEMISDGDKIAVGISGGKDSLTLLLALNEYKKSAKCNFEIVAVIIDIFGNTDYAKIAEFCQKLGIELVIERTDIKQIVFDIRHEKNPCSLCANLRRGHLNSSAKKLHCNKVALGHHADDFVQTFLMSIAKENRLSTFWPVSYLSKTDLYVIRPLLYVKEDQIKEIEHLLPVVQNTCPANKQTEREHAKKVLELLEHEFPNFKKNLFSALTETSRYNLLDKVGSADHPPKRRLN